MAVNSFWKLVSVDRFTKLKAFALKCTRCLETHVYACESTFSTMKQVKFKNRDRMADETLDDIHRLAAAKHGTDKGTMVSKKPRPQASH